MYMTCCNSSFEVCNTLPSTGAQLKKKTSDLEMEGRLVRPPSTDPSPEFQVRDTRTEGPVPRYNLSEARPCCDLSRPTHGSRIRRPVCQ